MRKQLILFQRTLGLLKSLGLEFKLLENNQDSQELKAFEKELSNYINSQKGLNKTLLNSLLEIFSIEKEKVSLTATKSELIEIIKYERVFYEKRENLLSRQISDFYNTPFVFNPLISNYEAYCDWSSALTDSNSIYKKIINNYETNIFFVFQKTGIYDSILDTNILEQKINEYEYFLLHIFTEQQTLLSGINRFEEEFNVKTVEESLLLRKNTEDLIWELMYRTYLVESKLELTV